MCAGNRVSVTVTRFPLRVLNFAIFFWSSAVCIRTSFDWVGIGTGSLDRDRLN